MKLSDFILLPDFEKKHILLHQGVLIGKRKVEYHMVFLFQMDNYYVESFCDVESKAVEEFRVLFDPRLLAPSLETIPIDGLVN